MAADHAFSLRPQHSNWPKFIALALVLVSAAIAGLALYVGLNARQLMHPAINPTGAFTSNIVPTFETVSFKDRDSQVKLSGWLFKTAKLERVVILVHPQGSNRLPFGDKTFTMIKELLENNWAVLTFDLRASGTSGGDRATFGLDERFDVLGAVAYAKSLKYSQIVVAGFSTGAVAALSAAAETRDITGVIADSPYADFNQMIRKNAWAMIGKAGSPLPDAWLLKTAEFLDGVTLDARLPLVSLDALSPRPVLFIHQKDDPVFPFDGTKRLYELYGRNPVNPVTLWTTPGSRHAAAFEENPQSYMKTVTDFLASTLPKTAQTKK